MKKKQHLDPRTLAVPAREDDLHRQVVAFCAVALPSHVVWFHTPNGGKRDKATAALLKALGVLPGVLDLAFFWFDGELRAAWLELKSASGTLSEDQSRFITRIGFAGHRTEMARTLEEAVDALERMGVPMRGRVSA